MIFSIGLGEVLSFAVVLIGAGWGLIKLTFNQFEKRLDEKLVTLDLAVTEIKRLEIEIIRNDARAAQLYATKTENEKSLERIFTVLARVESCMHLKISREEVERLIDTRKPNV